jgi:4-alpha-glucanotransferase
MKIHFYLRYTTAFGESLSLQLGPEGQSNQLPMTYLNQEFWYASVELPDSTPHLEYRYQHHDARRRRTTDDWDTRRLDLAAFKKTDTQVVDTWNAPGNVENAFDTQPFRRSATAPKKAATTKKSSAGNVLFRVKAVLLPEGQVPCLLGAGQGLHDWSRTQPLVLEPAGDWYETWADLSHDTFPVAYKYGIWDTQNKQFVAYETGDNRSLYFAPDGPTGRVVLHDGFVQQARQAFRGAGVAIPVFSLRSEQGLGIGEFADLPRLADWAHSVGFKIIQLLPINDTAATGTWTDSYPYASISAFALNPIYLNLEQVAGKAHAALVKPLAALRKQLNALEAVDYEAVLTQKWKTIGQLYAAMKADFAADAGFQAYFSDNAHWLRPYAAFCFLKEKNGTTDFGTWSTHRVYDAQAVEQLTAPTAQHYDQVAIHYFVQWHLHLQLRAATEYAHSKGLSVKGDIPIGIYRYSCDAWVAPELYNMGRQSGAPPDDFAEKGQNWGFPTYNWDRMKADGFGWWRQRFEQMSHYFDAFRIDHILGFFRIWSIPLDAVEGILGQFVPAIPVREQELWEAGIGFDYERLCRPYITDRVLWETFGDDTSEAHFFLQKNDTTRRYAFKPEYDTQRKLEAFFEQKPATDEQARLRDGLYSLLSNVILLPVAGTDDAQAGYAFRFGIDKTTSFRHLEGDLQQRLNSLYINYFYRRQDDFWEREALEKLPALKRSTQMLICGEDLGMVPDCVPGVMRDLGILSLEIQRMPKTPGQSFFDPKDAPYLSVVTPSTHDMSTIRGWWEEDRASSQRFYNEQLGRAGEAPYFCEPWLNLAIVEQHFFSPAMWSIFQLQDLLGIDGDLRRPNPDDERINVPANPKHYWQYRMHLTLDQLAGQAAFNQTLTDLVQRSGRF